jgi:hypothetical protein
LANIHWWYVQNAIWKWQTIPKPQRMNLKRSNLQTAHHAMRRRMRRHFQKKHVSHAIPLSNGRLFLKKDSTIRLLLSLCAENMWL